MFVHVLQFPACQICQALEEIPDQFCGKRATIAGEVYLLLRFALVNLGTHMWSNSGGQESMTATVVRIWKPKAHQK